MKDTRVTYVIVKWFVVNQIRIDILPSIAITFVMNLLQKREQIGQS